MNIKNDFPMVSVIIATYNSEKVLERTLVALRKQTYPQELLEVILIDGGSTDNTLELAKLYECVVLENPKTDPVNAKMIGFNYSHGKYVVTLDHDEVLDNENSITNRVIILSENKECKVAFCSGYRRPQDYPGLNQYISEYGDPFSLFIYRFSKDEKFFLHDLAKRAYTEENNEKYAKFVFGNDVSNVILELCCVATMIDKEYFASISDFLAKPDEMVHLFYIMLSHGVNSVIVAKNDPVVHYSVDSIRAYIPKLKWRIINNIHYPERSEQGYSGRKNYATGFSKNKKYFFILYSLSIFIPLIDSTFMSIKRKNISYLWHFLLSIFVSIYIIYQYFRKIIGLTPKLKTYDGKKVIYSEHRNEKDSI